MFARSTLTGWHSVTSSLHSEAVAMGLPVIIERNHWTLPQERYNAEWVEEQGVGISLRSFRREITGGCGRSFRRRRRRSRAQIVRPRLRQLGDVARVDLFESRIAPVLHAAPRIGAAVGAPIVLRVK